VLSGRQLAMPLAVQKRPLRPGAATASSSTGPVSPSSSEARHCSCGAVRYVRRGAAVGRIAGEAACDVIAGCTVWLVQGGWDSASPALRRPIPHGTLRNRERSVKAGTVATIAVPSVKPSDCRVVFLRGSRIFGPPFRKSPPCWRPLLSTPLWLIGLQLTGSLDVPRRTGIPGTPASRLLRGRRERQFCSYCSASRFARL
jgi:hypothetical protein